jgi:hypothetical protein
MDRMKTFFRYALLFFGFMFLSYLLENGLIANMYATMDGTTSTGSYDVTISDMNGKASNVNGYLNFKVKNTSGSLIERCYAKIDLYSKQGLLAATKYVEISDFEPDEEKEFQVKFKASEIDSYEVSIINEMPDKSNIINILGWEIDLTNVFGMDLTNLTIFGVKLTDLFNWDNIKTTGTGVWSWLRIYLATIPWWGYAIASGIVLWYMPVGFLFGIFPL